VYYQPIVALPDGDLIGLEALIRWRHPTRGLLSPGLFIPLAEETGLIHDLGLNVLDQACRQVKTWQEQLPFGRSLTVSVNVSPRQLDRAHLGDEILAVLIRTGFNPVNLILEITETALIEDLVALQQLQQLRDNGVRIAIDDFGTGYSSISQLTRLPIDILKIDQSFVAKLNGQPEGSAVAEAVIRLAQALHLDTVAEGVETHSQATELILLGCQRAQGFLYARPAPADETEALVLRSIPRAAADDPVPDLPRPWRATQVGQVHD
jgi:EAL domain-containing protein (putative c-di-GMP-specific phosphodiesterase class I)